MQAVAPGVPPSALDSEAFDEAWYGLTYPQARADVVAGRAVDLEDHYEQLGRHRGYLPNPQAHRPDNAASHRGRFGGLWTDLNNASDILEGKRRLGWIDERRHALLADFIRDGYVILPGAVPPRLLDPARKALEDAYDGLDPGQNFLGKKLPGSHWRPQMKEYPAKANEIHTRSASIRNASFAPAIVEFLTLLFERPILLSQTLGFYRGSAQQVHQDSAYVAYTLPTQFAASWIALEDVSPDAGELCYFPRSHHFPDHLFFGRYKGAWEANRHLDANGGPADAPAFERWLAEEAASRGLKLETFLAKAGDVLIWAANLAHGGRPVSTQRTRKSLVSHYCPSEVSPGYFEDKPGREIRRHPSGHFYSTWLDFDHAVAEAPQPAPDRSVRGRLGRLMRRLR